MLRWPLEADPFYRALDTVCVRPEVAPDDAELPPAIDAAAFSGLEQSVGGTKAKWPENFPCVPHGAAILPPCRQSNPLKR